MFYKPGQVFGDLPERRTAWVWPLVVNTVLLVLSTALTIHVMGMDLIIRQSMANSSMSPEQMRIAMERATSPAAQYFSYAAVAIGTPLSLLVIAGALFAFGLMTKRAPAFPSMLAMVSYSFFPYFLVTVIMTALVVIAAPDKTALDTRNLLATNVGAFMSRSETSKGLYALYSSLDVLSLFEAILLSLGFSKITRSGIAGGLAAVGGLWIFYVACKMALSLLQ